MVWLCTFLPFCPKIDSLAIRRQIKAFLAHLVPFWFLVVGKLVIGLDCSQLYIIARGVKGGGVGST